jgi:hypothetical protein
VTEEIGIGMIEEIEKKKGKLIKVIFDGQATCGTLKEVGYEVTYTNLHKKYVKPLFITIHLEDPYKEISFPLYGRHPIKIIDPRSGKIIYEMKK